MFSFFAEDVGLLPGRLFERLMQAQVAPERLRAQLQALFATMREGGLFGVDDVPWFNGGLFAAACSRVGWTRPSAASSARTTPTRPRSCGWWSRW